MTLEIVKLSRGPLGSSPSPPSLFSSSRVPSFLFLVFPLGFLPLKSRSRKLELSPDAFKAPIPIVLPVLSSPVEASVLPPGVRRGFHRSGWGSDDDGHWSSFKIDIHRSRKYGTMFLLSTWITAGNSHYTRKDAVKLYECTICLKGFIPISPPSFPPS